MSKNSIDSAIEQRRNLTFTLYSPVDYTDKSWLQSWNISAALPARLINHYLIKQSQMQLIDTENSNELNILACIDTNILLQSCLEHWNAMPKISYVLGTHYLRPLILKMNYVSHLNYQAIRFIYLPTLVCPFDAIFTNIKQLNDEVITATGMLVLTALFTDFPKIISCLWPLTLPHSTYRLFLQYPRIKASARDRFLYKAALAHVQNYCSSA